MIDVTEPTTVEVDALVQAVHPVGYDSFARAELVHRTPGTSPDELLAVAVEAAAAADLAIVVVGTNEEIESEGYDRTSLALPGTQDQLVKATLAANPNTIVVVNAGAPVMLPWLDEVPCVVWAWLGGQEWPEALADVLTGVTEPAGPPALDAARRTSPTSPCPDAVPVDGVVDYHEGVHVGYRSWLALGRTPAAPFGHGLGWTTWEYESVASSPRRRRWRRAGRRRPQHGDPRRSRGRPGLRRAARGLARRASVRCAGSAVSLSCTPSPARTNGPGTGGRASVPHLGRGTARLGHPGRYLPDPRGPFVGRPAPRGGRGPPGVTATGPDPHLLVPQQRTIRSRPARLPVVSPRQRTNPVSTPAVQGGTP